MTDEMMCTADLYRNLRAEHARTRHALQMLRDKLRRMEPGAMVLAEDIAEDLRVIIEDES